MGGSGGACPPRKLRYPCLAPGPPRNVCFRCLASSAAVPCPRALPPIFFRPNFFVRIFELDYRSNRIIEIIETPNYRSYRSTAALVTCIFALLVSRAALLLACICSVEAILKAHEARSAVHLLRLHHGSGSCLTFRNALLSAIVTRAVHSGERGCYRSNRKNYRIDRIELRKKNVFGRLFFFVGRSEGDGAVLIISKNLRRQIF